jgi:hypothetical protein
MGVTIKANFPNMDKGTELDVGGVLVKNGGSTELTDEEEQSFVSRHRKSVKDWAGDNEYVKVSGTGKFSSKQVEDQYPEPAGVQPILDDVTVPPADEGDKS